ncbi:hypothetical protein [Rugamonas apoptosis]|uniref:Uncharacterized protein n=1 Tax=Rugamonas apoptosis TaxID=2758570 RepID=A0A7W2IK42_9BURK|nr:hypothetical protein [Rugamonas apoptosis]MBA5686956.1 hypothetical protein [Rugamonas apoptosis]
MHISREKFRGRIISIPVTEYSGHAVYLYSRSGLNINLVVRRAGGKRTANRNPASSIRPRKAGTNQRSVTAEAKATMSLKPSEMEKNPAGAMRMAG